METPVTDTTKLREVIAFLDGSGELEGVSFGEIPDGERGKYWWRKHLPALLAKSDRADALEAGMRRAVLALAHAAEKDATYQSAYDELAALLPADAEGE